MIQTIKQYKRPGHKKGRAFFLSGSLPAGADSIVTLSAGTPAPGTPASLPAGAGDIVTLSASQHHEEPASLPAGAGDIVTLSGSQHHEEPASLPAADSIVTLSAGTPASLPAIYINKV